MTGRPMRSTRRVQNLAVSGTLPWYRIDNSVADVPTKVHIYDEIGFWGVNSSQFVNDVSRVSGDLEVHVNSPGGDVFEAIAIYNHLKQRSGTVHMVIDGLAASAASFIAQAASPGCLLMAPHSTMMIHDGFGMGIGNADDMRTLADQLDVISDKIAGIYADRSGKPAEHWRALMRAETWLEDQATVDAGLADGIVGQAAALVSSWNLAALSNGRWFNADKYSQADRDTMAKSGEAMEDGSYPIRDGEDLDNAIRAVGRGGSSHDEIRRHIRKRAEALGQESKLPDNWRQDGSMMDASNLVTVDPGRADAAGLSELFMSVMNGPGRGVR